MKKKGLEKLTITIIFLILTFSLTQFTPPKKISKYSYTKAICDKNNYCEDYYIECEENKLTKLTPTGFTIQKNSNWTDSRQKRELCD